MTLAWGSSRRVCCELCVSNGLRMIQSMSEAFVYKDGFARFTTVPYNTSSDDIDNKWRPNLKKLIQTRPVHF